MSDKTRREFLRQVVGGFTIPALGLESNLFGNTRVRHENDHPAVHGMVLFGQRKIFLSHLPLFSSNGHRSPHNFQAILEASFSDPQHYQQDLAAVAKNPWTLFTIEPDPFLLNDLNSAAETNRQIKSIQATVYRGHFERGGTPLIRDAELVVEKVVHFRSFDLDEQRPKRLSYIVFGGGSELFLAHRITRPPDFDQILSVTFDENLSGEVPATGTISTAYDLIDSVDRRIKEKQKANCDIISPNGKASRKTVKITAVREIYFETGDLAS
jgi:hypothetical protein